jgi:hypothetical protein
VLITEVLKSTELYSLTSTLTWVTLGASIGISAGFGYVISQRLFAALLN